MHLEVQYLKEARQGDELIVRTSVAEVGRSSIVFHQVASPAELPEEITAEARVRAVFIGVEGRPARIPPEVRAALGA